MKKKLNKVPSAGTKDDSSTKDEEMHVSPAIAKPNVVGSQSPVSTEIGIDEYGKPLNYKGGKMGASYTIRDRSEAIFTITNKQEHSDWEISSD